MVRKELARSKQQVMNGQDIYGSVPVKGSSKWRYKGRLRFSVEISASKCFTPVNIKANIKDCG